MNMVFNLVFGRKEYSNLLDKNADQYISQE